MGISSRKQEAHVMDDRLPLNRRNVGMSIDKICEQYLVVAGRAIQPQSPYSASTMTGTPCNIEICKYHVGTIIWYIIKHMT
jgi:hypothetical protein